MSLPSNAQLLTLATATRPVGVGCEHVAERRPDLDPGVRTLAYVCPHCGAVGHASVGRRERVYWKDHAPESAADDRSRARAAAERAWTREGWRP